MKRRSALPLLLCLLVLLLTACGNGGKENNTTTWTTEQMAGAILAAGDSTAQVSAIRSQEAQFASYAEGYYRLNEAVEEGTILYVGRGGRKPAGTSGRRQGCRRRWKRQGSRRRSLRRRWRTRS